MEENVVKFQEKLKNLVALAKKKKNILEIQEINDAFRDMELEPTQMGHRRASSQSMPSASSCCRQVMRR